MTKIITAPKTKIPALLLVILLLLSCIPTPVSAETVEEDWLPTIAIWQAAVSDGGTLRYDGVSEEYLWHAWIINGSGQTSWTPPDGVSTVDALVIGGGGGGGGAHLSGGGGAGELFYDSVAVSGSKTINIGNGGAGATTDGGNGGSGGNSVFGDITVLGGGGGGGNQRHGLHGGSGGGGGNDNGVGGSAIGSYIGYTGGNINGGGGGAGERGYHGSEGHHGGDGLEIWGRWYAGGGGGAGLTSTPTYGNGGLGGGGRGGCNQAGVSGSPNTGSGGGAGGWTGYANPGGNGGSGIIIIRYQISLESTAPIIYLSASPRSGSPPLNVSFTDGSARYPTAWIWYYRSTGTSGWTQFSTDQHPLYQFNTSGIYDIRLTASNDEGSSSRTYSSFIQITTPPPENTTLPWQFRYDPMTGIYTRIWFDPGAALPDVDLIWTATLLPIISLLGSLFFVWIWLLIVAGSWLYTQDTTSAYVVGLISGTAMSTTASLIGADGAVLMVIVVGFAGAGVLARVIVGKG